jgi:hypothetical protein
MTFEQYGHTGIDTPPALEQLRGLSGVGAFGAAPLLVGGAAGAAAAAAAVASWLTAPDWNVGQYNYYMASMDSTIKEMDKLGWSTGCWQKNPAKLRQFKTYWAKFSKHWSEYGRQSVYLPDSAELPARDLLKELGGWIKWFEKTCGSDLGPTVHDPDAVDPTHDPTAGGMDWGPIVKWGAIGLGALVALNVISGIRGAIPQRGAR